MPGDSPRFDLYGGRRGFSLSAKRRGNSRRKEYPSLSHTRWDGKYPMVFIPKRRKKCVFGVPHRQLGAIFHELAGHQESPIVEGHLLSDHLPRCISIPPKYAVANGVGHIKGKRAIHRARKFAGRQRNFTGENFGARGYFLSTVGLDENTLRAYIRNQEREDARYDEMKVGVESAALGGPRCYRAFEALTR